MFIMKKIKILDLSTLIPGPFATFLLGKYIDTKIIKIEDINRRDQLADLRPSRDGVGLGYRAINDSKKIILIDWKKDGVEVVKKEIKDADILIENFREGKAFKMGIGFDDLIKINPNIIYVSIKGYSKSGTMNRKAAHDANILALSGYLDQQIKSTNAAILPPVQIADLITSYQTTLQIMAALLNGEKGKLLEVSMEGAMSEAMIIYNHPQLILKKEINPRENLLAGLYPCYSIYTARDGRSVVVAAVESVLWNDFCHHLNRKDLILRQFDESAKKEVEKEMKKYDFKHWLERDLDFCVTPVLSVNEANKLKIQNLLYFTL